MISAASAADLPVKAKAAVQYVKICTLYGAGFYYVPGTDTCLKIGGYLRTQVESNSAGGGIAVGSSASVQGNQTRTQTNDVQTRVRAVVTLDTRTQGEYGTLRSYYRVGWESTTPGETLGGTAAGRAYWDRAFIQFAGFTVGKAQSFFDIYHHGGARNYLNTRTSGDNGASGGMLWAYTAQFGGGFSATLSLEDPVGHNLVGVGDINTAGTVIGALNFGATDNGLVNNAGGFGMQVPDIVGNLRVDQPWGYVGVSAALHQVAGGYYTTANGCAVPNTTACGHPSDEWGYALGVGGELKIPGMPGDTAGAMFRYTKGAVGYALGAGANAWLLVQGNTIGAAFARDAYFANPAFVPGYAGALELTEAMSLNGHYEHLWTPTLKTSVYAGWAQINHTSTAKALICGGVCPAGANPDFSFWQVGSRTEWSPWKGQLNVGVDVVYTALDAARVPGVGPAVSGIAAPQTTAGKHVGDTDNVMVMFRVQRNWYP
jgi:hypothetical protein